MTDVIAGEAILVENNPREWLKAQRQEEYQWELEHGLNILSPGSIYYKVGTWASVDIQEMMELYTIEDQEGDVAEFRKAAETVIDKESYDKWVFSVHESLFLPMFEETKVDERSEEEVCVWALAMRGLDRLRRRLLAQMIRSGNAEDLENNYRGDIWGKYWYEPSDWSMMSDALTIYFLTKEQPANEIIRDLVEDYPLIHYGRRCPIYYSLITKPGEWQKREWGERRERQRNEAEDL